MKPIAAFYYSVGKAPMGYECAECGASGCKLWRQYQTFASHIRLLCVVCAGKDQSVDTSDVDSDGRFAWKDMGTRTDSIAWLVPAIPTEDGETFWGYTSVPQIGVYWWRGLPSNPDTKEEGQ
jgi:hypothetical protein